MDFDLSARTARLSVGELADFSVGPRDSGEGQSGIWRAQLGSHWHREMQAQTSSESPDARFEVTIAGEVVHRGWILKLTGRIDQVVPDGSTTVLREIKTRSRPVPVPEPELRAEYPHYFAQLATYLTLHRLSAPTAPLRGELVFVETGSGLSQTLRLAREDESLFEFRLERFAQFLDLHHRALQRRQSLQFAPAFPPLRSGQEDTQTQLETALASRSVVTFEAPTGFGKTGVMLETALHALRAGRCDRIVYLTSKSTGQLQVVETLRRMTAPDVCHVLRDKPDTPAPSPSGLTESTPLAIWHVRNKGEHCVNHTFHCVRDQCRFINDVEARWPQSSLDRFHLFESHPRDLPTLRDAGRDAGICPYEITRTSLAFQDVWVGDYNYVFAPCNRTLFENQPGWNPARTLLMLDEAHHLPARVADAHSHLLTASATRAVLTELDHQRAPRSLTRAWESLVLLLSAQRVTEQIDVAAEDNLTDVLARIADQLPMLPLDYAALGPELADTLWSTAELVDWLRNATLPRLLWTPREGELHFTCLDVALITGNSLRSFGQVVLASATIGPSDAFAASIGIDPEAMARVNALTPWREGSYDVAVDLLVDTRYQQRPRHDGTTAATIGRLHAAADGAGVVFSPATPTPSKIVSIPTAPLCASPCNHAYPTSPPKLRGSNNPSRSPMCSSSS
ncbi:MAG: PhoH family protein [Candidatus Synoicihabitans palmerolidicus]|nr:PhoH family protein [Candidatus Synoicihabitans palmerolidicus]